MEADQFMASYAMPPVMAPSPMTAMQLLRRLFSSCLPTLMPWAALMDVEEWPAPKQSNLRRRPASAGPQCTFAGGGCLLWCTMGGQRSGCYRFSCPPEKWNAGRSEDRKRESL